MTIAWPFERFQLGSDIANFQALIIWQCRFCTWQPGNVGPRNKCLWAPLDVFHFGGRMRDTERQQLAPGAFFSWQRGNVAFETDSLDV